MENLERQLSLLTLISNCTLVDLCVCYYYKNFAISLSQRPWLCILQHLNELVRTCIEEYINKSHSSIIRQLKAEVDQLKKSRDEWKEIADKLRKEIALVQSTHQRTERRRSSVTRVGNSLAYCHFSLWMLLYETGWHRILLFPIVFYSHLFMDMSLTVSVYVQSQAAERLGDHSDNHLLSLSPEIYVNFVTICLT